MRHLPCHTASFFFFNDTATTEIYTLSLHDALPISAAAWRRGDRFGSRKYDARQSQHWRLGQHFRSEEHTSELQSRPHLVCRLLLEKKNYTAELLANTLPALIARCIVRSIGIIEYCY